MSADIQLHAIVHGRVQGVSFRYYTKQRADSLGITGWVRNRPNRTVEVVAEGSKADMAEFVKFLKQGPPSARVDNVDLSEGEATGEFKTFEITYYFEK